MSHTHFLLYLQSQLFANKFIPPPSYSHLTQYNQPGAHEKQSPTKTYTTRLTVPLYCQPYSAVRYVYSILVRLVTITLSSVNWTLCQIPYSFMNTRNGICAHGFEKLHSINRGLLFSITHLFNSPRQVRSHWPDIRLCNNINISSSSLYLVWGEEYAMICKSFDHGHIHYWSAHVRSKHMEFVWVKWG
jgi:hypothetical protein